MRAQKMPDADPLAAPMRCADCASHVWEVWSGEPPNLVLSVEVEHSHTCPAWREPGREIAFQLLPKSATETTEETR